MKNKIKKVGKLLTVAMVILITVVFFANQTSAVDNQQDNQQKKQTNNQTETITVNALLFDQQGQLVSDGTYNIRFALYTIDRVKTDNYPSDKDKEERIWETNKRIELKDGKLKTKLNIPSVEYNKYYLGIRVNQDSEMVPRKALVLGKNSLSLNQNTTNNNENNSNSEQQEKETQIINENFTKQEETNQTLIEAVNQLQIGTNPGDIPILNSNGKIGRSLLDLPVPAGGGGVSNISLDMANISDNDITNIINNLANNETFINNTISSFTSNNQDDGDTIVYDNTTNRYISTPFELGSLNNVDISSVDDKDILIYDEDEDEWVNKPIADYSTVYTAGIGININNNQISLIDTVDDDTLASLSCNDNEIAKWNNTTHQWECAIDAGGVGSTTFAALTDTPAGFGGMAGRLTRVNGASTGLEFFDGSIYLDNTDNQQISRLGDTITLSNGTGLDSTVDLTPYINTDNQDLTLTGNILAISNDLNTNVDLSGYLDNTDTQTLSFNTGTSSLAISGGNSIDLSDLNDEYLAGTALNLAGSTFNLSDTAVTTGSYGNATQAATFTVDQQGRLTVAGQTTITPDWTSITNVPADIADGDDDTTYTVGGTILNLTGTTFSLNEGTLTDTRICTYVAGTGLVCDTTNNAANWDTAFGWGNHASAGYLTDAPSDGNTYGRNNGAWTIMGSGTPADNDKAIQFNDNGVFGGNATAFSWDNNNTTLNIFGINNSMRFSYDASNYVDLSTNSTGEFVLDATNGTESAMIMGNGSDQDNSIQFDGANHDFFSGIDSATNSYSIGSGLNVTGSAVEIGPGTVTNTAGGTTITGTNTVFTRTFKVGNQITIGAETVTITDITDDTHMTTTAITNANTNAPYTYTAGTVLTVEPSGAVGIGITNPAIGGLVVADGVTIGADSTDNLIDNATNGSNSSTLYIGNRTIDTSASDKRVKDIQGNTKLGLDDIMKFQVVDFTWKENFDDDSTTVNTGLIAQDVYTQFPYLAQKPQDEKTGLWTVKYNYLSALAIKGIQELHKRQEEQAVKINKINTVLKIDEDVNALDELQSSVNDNLTIINQTLVTMQTSQEAINSQQELKNSEQEEAITGNTQSLATLSENITDLAETSDLLVNTVDDHETRIALLEDTISKIQDTNGQDTSNNNQDTNNNQGNNNQDANDQDTNNQDANDGQDPNNPQTPNLTNLSEALESFSTNLALTEEGTTCTEEDEDCILTQPVFTLSGDLIVERLKAKKIEAEEIEVGKVSIQKTSKMIGFAVICPVGERLKDGKCEDDLSGDNVSDGKSVFVENNAVGQNTTIFTTFENNPGTASWVEKTKDEDGEFDGFTINLENVVTGAVTVNWWIVEMGVSK